MFLFLALAFGLGFVGFGVGAGGIGIGDVFRDAAGGAGVPSISDSEQKVLDNPKDAQAFRDLATAYQAEGTIDDAIEAMQSYVALRPEDTDALRELAALYLQQATEAQERAQIYQVRSAYLAPGSIRDTIFQLKGSPLTPDPITNAMSTAYEREISAAASEIQAASAQAVEQYRKITELQPNDPNVQLELAQAARVGERHRDDDRRVRGIPQARTGRPDGAPRSGASSSSTSSSPSRADPPRIDSPPVRPVLLVAVASAGALALALSGCGTGGYTSDGSQGAGKTLFIQACGGCHTLAAAGTNGTIGPNLDDAFAQAREVGMTSETFTQVVAGQIRFPITETGRPELPACPGSTRRCRSCDDVEGDAFCVDDQDSGRRRHRRLRRRRRRHGRHRRATDRRQVDLHGELRLVPHARRRRDVRSCRAEPRRGEAAEGARRRSRDERPGRDAVVQGLARRRADPGRRGLRLVAPPASSAAWLLAALGGEIDDDVRDGHVVARANRLDDASLEPVGLPRRMGRDDDLARAERPDRVVDGDERVAVADLAARLDADRARAARA